MRGELVAIDLETTGLDIDKEAIIEIGAVRMKDGEIIDEYKTYVDPNRPIPALITGLTGIRNEDVIGAPRIAAVLPAVRAFVGSAPIIGHNVRYDTGFLQRHGILQNNVNIDTYELASVLLPRAPRYNLNSLTSELDVELEHAHRALDDAKAAALIYWKLWQKALQLPIMTLTEIVNAAQGINWDARPVFEAALTEREQTDDESSSPETDLVKMFGKPPKDRKPLQPHDDIEPVDGDRILEIIDENGLLSQALPHYELRDQQIDMAILVNTALNQGDHVMIEAGTGTGKSLAYLVPAVLWSTTNSERVVISTNTINLQDQLLNKDIPNLKEAIGINFNAAVIKGRSNYLCPRRLATARRRRPGSVDELRTLAKILVWMLESTTGDKGEINLRGPIENITWQRLSAEDEGCTTDRCRASMEGTCPFYKARRAAEAAHILIVNHALLISDAMTENRVLPEYNYIVLDEAHHIEDATTNGLSFRLDEITLRRRLNDLGSANRGLLGNVLNSVKASTPEREFTRLETFVGIISDATSAMEIHIGNLFTAVRRFADDAQPRRQSEYLVQLRVTPELRARNSFALIHSTWNTLNEFFEGISEAMAHLTTALKRLESYDIADFDDLVNSTGTAAQYLQEVEQQLRTFATKPDPNTVYWLSYGQENDNVSIQSAPLHVGPLIDKYLWSSKDSVIMTSATLQTNGNFNYVRERLQAEDIHTFEVGSPFNYRDSTLLYIPTDIPEPNDRHGYQQAVERGLIELAAALDGRVLGLFTSYAQLRQTSQAITPRLALGNITVYDQSDGSSRQALLDGFKSSDKSVLLGTKSFWEGVDIPGEALSALVIVRLPFAVPSDPIFSARSETYANSFAEYALPDAILRFRQGFGRLIRTKTDRGVVAVFDNRLTTKGYGKNFIDALPNCTLQRGTLEQLPGAARKWLNLDPAE